MKNPPVILIVAAALFAIVILGAFLLPNVVGATAPGVQAQRSSVSTQEADAWAEARAADTPAAYRVYLAAYPQGAFAQNAQQELTPAEPVQAAQAAPAAPRRIAQTSNPNSPWPERGRNRVVLPSLCRYQLAGAEPSRADWRRRSRRLRSRRDGGRRRPAQLHHRRSRGRRGRRRQRANPRCAPHARVQCLRREWRPGLN